MPVTEDTQQLPAPDDNGGGSLKTRVAALLGAATRSKAVLAVTVGVVALAVAGATYGYTAMAGTPVTLSVDGQERQIDAEGDTVAEVLEAEGIEVGKRDLVQPDLDETVDDGTKIAVRFARPVELTVDGETETHWVTATSVNGALDQIGTLYRDARLSTSRGATIDRGGLSLEVVTEKKFTVTLAGRKPATKQVAALTVGDALKALDVELDKHDVVRPGLKREVEDGDKIEYVDFEVKRKQVEGQSYTVEQIVRENDDELEGTETVVREGRAGVRDVVYRVVIRNGEQISQQVISTDVVREAVAEIVEVGTKEEPTTNFASGSTVWDALAQCESGGNWAINTGNGYYGGLQFSLSTWRAYGGAGYPHQQSREYQIMIAERVRAATGGYGSWPHCSAQLGLPQ